MMNRLIRVTSTAVTTRTRNFMEATSWSTLSRLRRRSSTPRTFISAGWAWHCAWPWHARRQVGRFGFGQCLGGAGAVLRIGGEHHLAGAIEHADAVDALFEGDGLHDLVGGLAMVVQHGVPGGAGDGFGELIGAQEYGV